MHRAHRLLDHRLLGTVAIGCAIASACTAPRGPDRPADRETARSFADAIPTTWQALADRALAVYVGPWVTAPAADVYGCIAPARAISGNGALTDGGYCVRSADWLMGPSWLAAPTPAEAWAATVAIPGESPVTAVAGTREALVETVRCGMLDRTWQRIPADDLRCTTEGDCQLLESMCFYAVVATRAVAPYRELVDRFGGTCLHPAGGACPPADVTPACIEGRCTASFD